MQLTIRYPLPPRRPSSAASIVMDCFGISAEAAPVVIAEDLELPVQPGDVVCFTGPSGSGKSSLLRGVAAQLEQEDPGSVVDIAALKLPEVSLVDALALPVEEALALLSAAGLAEARLLLRTPAELSDGQRYRFRLAAALARQPKWIVADEFTATLDRHLACVIAFNLRRQASRAETGFLLATTHEDMLDDLQPDLHVRTDLDGCTRVRRADVKKNGSPAPASANSPRPPARTGRTLLGGITAATASGFSASPRCCGTGKRRSASACSLRPRTR